MLFSVFGTVKISIFIPLINLYKTFYSHECYIESTSPSQHRWLQTLHKRIEVTNKMWFLLFYSLNFNTPCEEFYIIRGQSSCIHMYTSVLFHSFKLFPTSSHQLAVTEWFNTLYSGWRYVWTVCGTKIGQ